MKIAFYLNVISPHQLPFAREVVRRIGAENFRYVYAESFHAERKSMGWNDEDVPEWCMKGDGNTPELMDADLVYTGIRCASLMARRSMAGRKTVYYSERWFKPPLGILRLLSPSYFKMARRFFALLRNGDGLTYCPVGIHSARDMARLCGLMQGDLRCLFRAPRLGFESKPGERIWEGRRKREEGRSLYGDRYCLDKMRMWGYFVEEGRRKREEGRRDIRVLWVGRLLGLKRVDTIIRAVGELSTRLNSPTPTSNSNSSLISLDIYGAGPEEIRLKRMSAKYGDAIRFYPSVPIAEVRKLMRKHDVYVLASNAYEGWGAVVSEALEEGMRVLGTYEAGASAPMLPKERLFHAGDWRTLLCLLQKERDEQLPPCSIGDWTAEVAASRLVELA